ncbi:alkaline phosphatase D family protein [Virgibacillus necropolis]|uniref:alkaline phosphatase D family protein n=1 Tax=Virgibacillus necropolis TaxID=163877 RepID=UPI00384BDC70
MQIPTILSGPIIRRVESTTVYLWIATSEAFQIDAVLYQVIGGSANTPTYKAIEIYTETNTIHAGENMYIHLIKVNPQAEIFPTDTLIGYNILFTNRDEQLDLGSFNLLTPNNPQSIVYGNLAFPTFYIQQNNPSNNLYGSCRKPHSVGNNALISADITVQDHHSDVKKRPSSLFLMGDQIYADDVADPLFHVISMWSMKLMGNDLEQLTEVDKRLKLDPFHSAVEKIHGRQFIMEHFCKFTSSNAANHMMRFSEYAVMYLLTFGPQLWGDDLDGTLFSSFEQLMAGNQFYFMYPDKPANYNKRADEYENHEFRYNDQLKKLRPFIKSLPQVRRVLANTPTYMIFDDHDITDDWNISQEWKENVACEPLGKYVVTNGLYAYRLFQGWGNDPVKFNDKRKKATKLNGDEWRNEILNFRSWHFVPTIPRTLFLDTRTMREYDIVPEPIRFGSRIEEDTDAPQLIGEKGWEVIAATLEKSDWNKGDALAIVSPTPLYGIGVIESFLQKYVYPLRILGFPLRYAFDFEAWKYNGKGFNRFIQQLAAWNPSQCIILSGDVHYAGAVKSNVTFSDNQKITIQQFTSSPIQNMSFSGIWGKLIKSTIWFNSLKRKKRVICRSCDQQDNLILKATNSGDHKWREEIHYLTDSNGSIIETNNNIGLLSIDSSSVTNRLLQYNGQRKNEIFYTEKGVQSK